MSEYIGGPLDRLAILFCKAIKQCEDNDYARALIDQWNEEINYLNHILEVKNDE